MWWQSLRVTSCLCFSTSKITLQQKPFHTQTICNCNVSRHDSYYVLHPNPHKAISSRNTNSEVNAAAEWTDKQTLCHFWLGITSGVMEEDGASKVWPSLFIHTAWRNSKLTHPGGQMQRGCKTHHTHTHLVCLLTVDIAYPCPVPQWRAGDWQMNGCSVYSMDITLKPALSLTRMCTWGA